MFNDAETVNVLVPLSGQYENIRKYVTAWRAFCSMEMEKNIFVKARSSVLQKAADIFTEAKYKSA